MIIREFRRSDIKRVLEIEIESFKDPYPPSILVDIYNLGAGFLIALLDDNIVGYIIFWIRFEDEGHIISIAVDKKYRRRGIGTKLVNNVIQIFNRCNVKNIKLEVRANNQEARIFYEKSKFKENKIFKGYYEDGEDAIVMIMDLNEYLKGRSSELVDSN
jgi:[ribosomal protein S18]-alanine N-acetyltransferase